MQGDEDTSTVENSSTAAVEIRSTSTDLRSELVELERLATAVGAVSIAAEAVALSDRLAKGRFFVACVGQFKRGKSTLLNALIGAPVLPAGVAPVTSAVTILRYSLTSQARILFASGEMQPIALSDVASYAAEEHNPENKKGVAAVEVYLPDPLLASGMCLVDTPGLGSVFAGNTAVTRQFIPQIDAALVVLGADPPISGEELALVEAVARETRELVVVLNKADRLSPQELAEARAFTSRVLAACLGREVGPIFEVSARERLSTGPTRDWQPFYRALATLSESAVADMVRRAQLRGVNRLADRLLYEIDEQRGALTRPQAESERRIEALRGCMADAERSLRDLGPLFKAEQEALARTFEEKRRRFLAEAHAAAGRELDEAIDGLAEQPSSKVHERAAERAQAIAACRIEAWEREMEAFAEQLYRRAMERFVALGNSVLERLSTSGEPALAGLPLELAPEAGFRTKRRFQFHEILTLAAPGLGTRLLDLVRPRHIRIEATKSAAREYLERLLTTNSARVSNDLNERVLESRRRLEAELLSLLRELSRAAERSLEQARRRHAEGAAAVGAEVERLGAMRTRAVTLRRPMQPGLP